MTLRIAFHNSFLGVQSYLEHIEGGSVKDLLRKLVDKIVFKKLLFIFLTISD